jgi:hypothetical protein
MRNVKLGFATCLTRNTKTLCLPAPLTNLAVCAIICIHTSLHKPLIPTTNVDSRLKNSDDGLVPDSGEGLGMQSSFVKRERDKRA